MGIQIKNPLTGDVILEIPDPIEEAKKMYDTVTGWLGGIVTTLSNALNGSMQWIGNIMGEVTSFPSKLITNITGQVAATASTLGGNIRSGTSNLFHGIISAITKAFSALADGIFPKKEKEE